MDGISMLLGSALRAMGVELDPNEVKQTVEQAKVLIPAIAQRFEEMNQRLIEMEKEIVIMSARLESLLPQQ